MKLAEFYVGVWFIAGAVFLVFLAIALAEDDE